MARSGRLRTRKCGSRIEQKVATARSRVVEGYAAVTVSVMWFSALWGPICPAGTPGALIVAPIRAWMAW